MFPRLFLHLWVGRLAWETSHFSTVNFHFVLYKAISFSSTIYGHRAQHTVQLCILEFIQFFFINIYLMVTEYATLWVGLARATHPTIHKSNSHPICLPTIHINNTFTYTTMSSASYQCFPDVNEYASAQNMAVYQGTSVHCSMLNHIMDVYRGTWVLYWERLIITGEWASVDNTSWPLCLECMNIIRGHIASVSLYYLEVLMESTTIREYAWQYHT